MPTEKQPDFSAFDEAVKTTESHEPDFSAFDAEVSKKKVSTEPTTTVSEGGGIPLVSAAQYTGKSLSEQLKPSAEGNVQPEQVQPKENFREIPPPYSAKQDGGAPPEKETSYLGGSLKAFNQSAYDYFLKPLEGAEKVVEDLTGISFGNKEKPKLSEYLEKNDAANLKDIPNTMAGHIAAGTVAVIPMIAQMAMLPEARILQSVPKLSQSLGTTQALNTYGETGDVKKAVDVGLVGAQEGAILHGLGYAAGEIGNIAGEIAKSKPLASAAGATMNALLFGGYDAVKQKAETGQIDWNKVAESTGTGLALGLPVFAGIAYNKAIGNFFNTDKSTIQQINSIEKPVSDLRADAIDMTEKAASENNPEKKQQYTLAAATLNNTADIKAIGQQVLQDPAKHIEAINNDPELSPELKKEYTDKINSFVTESNPNFQKANEISKKIEEQDKQIQFIEQNNLLQQPVKDAMIKGINEQKKQYQSEIENLFKEQPSALKGGMEAEPQIPTENAIQEPTATEEVSRIGETGQNQPEGSQGVRQGEQGKEAAKVSPEEEKVIPAKPEAVKEGEVKPTENEQVKKSEEGKQEAINEENRNVQKGQNDGQKNDEEVLKEVGRAESPAETEAAKDVDLLGDKKADFMLTKEEYLQKLKDSNDYPVTDALWERVRTGDFNNIIKRALEFHNYIEKGQRGSRSEMRSAISEGRITPQDAVKIIESAGIDVPKDIRDMVKEPPTEPTKAEAEKIPVTEAEPLTEKQQKAKTFAESDLPTKKFNKKELLEGDDLPEGEINVKPIEKKAKVNTDNSTQGKAKLLKDVVSDDELRPAMTGVFHDAEAKSLVATDAMSLVIIPDKSIKKTEIIDPKTGKTIDGKFPNYKVVIPENNPIKVKINVQDFLNKTSGAARANEFFSYYKSNGEDIPITARIKIGDNEYFYNPKILNKVLRVFAESGIDEVTIELSRPNRAAVIKGGDITGLVMPIQTLSTPRFKTLLDRTMTAAEEKGVVESDIERIKQDIKYEQQQIDEAQKDKSEWGVKYHTNKLTGLQEELADRQSDLTRIDNPLQESADVKVVQENINNGTITDKRATEITEQSNKSAEKLEPAITTLEAKGEDAANNQDRQAAEEVIAGIDKLIEGGEAEQIVPKQGTLEITTQAESLYNQIAEAEGGAKKRSLAAERQKLLEDHPEIKRIDDNIKSITQQLEDAGLLKKKGNCP